MPELIDLQAQRRNAIELARGISKKRKCLSGERFDEFKTAPHHYFFRARLLESRLRFLALKWVTGAS